MPWFAFVLFCLLFYKKERERDSILYWSNEHHWSFQPVYRGREMSVLQRVSVLVRLLKFWSCEIHIKVSCCFFYTSLFLTFSSLRRQHQRMHTELLLLPPGRHSGSHTPGLPHCVCEVWQTEAQSREPQAVSGQLMTLFIISQTLTFTIPQPPTMWQTLSLLVFGKWGRI